MRRVEDTLVFQEQALVQQALLLDIIGIPKTGCSLPYFHPINPEQSKPEYNPFSLYNSLAVNMAVDQNREETVRKYQ